MRRRGGQHLIRAIKSISICSWDQHTLGEGKGFFFYICAQLINLLGFDLLSNLLGFDSCKYT